MKKSLVLITGYQMHQNHYAELGIGIMHDGVVGYHPSTTIYGISNEIRISKDPIWGLKAGIWLGGGVGAMNIGLNLINYTNFKQNSLRFRPEIGLGFSFVRLVYGYNIAITQKEFQGVNSHNFTLNIMLNLKTAIEENKILHN
ncbi:hypothetical protein GYB22_12130 [bacterium]|nr:hypothetical protein [bacterium]